jgi:hypothetical protein
MPTFVFAGAELPEEPLLLLLQPVSPTTRAAAAAIIATAIRGGVRIGASS